MVYFPCPFCLLVNVGVASLCSIYRNWKKCLITMENWHLLVLRSIEDTTCALPTDETDIQGSKPICIRTWTNHYSSKKNYSLLLSIVLWHKISASLRHFSIILHLLYTASAPVSDIQRSDHVDEASEVLEKLQLESAGMVFLLCSM